MFDCQTDCFDSGEKFQPFEWIANGTWKWWYRYISWREFSSLSSRYLFPSPSFHFISTTYSNNPFVQVFHWIAIITSFALPRTQKMTPKVWLRTNSKEISSGTLRICATTILVVIELLQLPLKEIPQASSHTGLLPVRARSQPEMVSQI